MLCGCGGEKERGYTEAGIDLTDEANFWAGQSSPDPPRMYPETTIKRAPFTTSQSLPRDSHDFEG